jgi:capsular polysaccharide biosynthesis protein
MDQVASVEIIDVDLPRAPAPDPTSRTVQDHLHPNLTRHYAPPDYPLRVAAVPNGRLALSGGVFSASGDLIRESLWDDPHFERDFSRMRSLQPATKLKGTGASLITLWGYNYFHWMFNALPRVAVLKASGISIDYLIVPANLRPFQQATLEILGFEGDALVPFTNEHVEVENLVWAAPLSPINEPSSYLLEWVRTEMRTSVELPTRQLYVSRRGGTRRAVNEDEVFSHLDPLGFEFILPEDYSFADQVKLFGQARVAIGPHGSNFVNGIFSDRLSVVECFQPEHVNWGVYSVLCAAGQDHWSLVCESVRRLRGPKRFADLLIRIDELDATLELIREELRTEPKPT